MYKSAKVSAVGSSAMEGATGGSPAASSAKYAAFGVGEFSDLAPFKGRELLSAFMLQDEWHKTLISWGGDLYPLGFCFRQSDDFRVMVGAGGMYNFKEHARRISLVRDVILDKPMEGHALIILGKDDLSMVSAVLQFAGLESSGLGFAFATCSGSNVRLFASSYEELITLYVKVCLLAGVQVSTQKTILAHVGEWSEHVPVLKMTAQGIVGDLVARVTGAAEALSELFSSLGDKMTGWIAEVMERLSAITTDMLANPRTFMRDAASEFVKGFLKGLVVQQIKEHVEELKILGKMIIRWAFGYSFSQLCFELLLDAAGSQKATDIFSMFSRMALGSDASNTVLIDGHSTGEESVLGLILTCLFTAIGMKDLPAGVRPSIGQAVKLMTLASRGSGTIASQFVGSLSFAKNAVLQAVYGPLYKRDELFTAWPSTGAAYEMACAYLAIEKPMLHQSKMMKECLAQYFEEWRKMQKEVQSQFTPFLPMILAAQKAVESIHLPSSRKQPRFFYWCGESGVGKSYLCKLAIDIMHKLYVERCENQGLPEHMIPRKRADFLFTYNASRAHFDGYRMQLVTLLVELFQFKATTETRGKEVPAFLNMLSNDDFEPPMAHLPNKGIPFNAAIVTGAGNTFPWEWTRILTEVASVVAFQRRVTDCILAQKKAGVQSVDQVVRHDNRKPDEYLDFFLMNPITGQKKRQVTFVEIVKMMFEACLEDPYEEKNPHFDELASDVGAASIAVNNVAGPEGHMAWHAKMSAQYPRVTALKNCKGCRRTLESFCAARARQYQGSVVGMALEISEQAFFSPEEVRQHFGSFLPRMLQCSEQLRLGFLVAKVGDDCDPEKTEEFLAKWPLDTPEAGMEYLAGLEQTAQGSWWNAFAYRHWGALKEDDPPIVVRVGEEGEKAIDHRSYELNMDRGLLAICKKAMRVKTNQAIWDTWRTLAPGIEPSDIPLWCTPFHVIFALYGKVHPGLQAVVGPIGFFRGLEDYALGKELPQMFSAAEMRSLCDHFPPGNVISLPLEPQCPLSWFTYGGSTRNWIRPEQLQRGKELNYGPELVFLGDRYAINSSPVDRKAIVLLVGGILAFAGIMLIGRKILLKRSVDDFERSAVQRERRSDLYAHGVAEMFPGWAKNFSTSDRNYLRSLVDSTFLLSFDGVHTVNAFAISQSEFITTAHSFSGGDFVLRRGSAQFPVYHQEGKGYTVIKEGDLAYVRMYDRVLPGCKEHSRKFEESLPVAGLTMDAIVLGREDYEGVCLLKSQETQAVFSRAPLSYRGPDGPITGGPHWVADYAGISGQCGSVLFVPGGAPHPLRGIHAAGGLRDGAVIACHLPVTQTLIAKLRSQIPGVRTEMMSVESDFLPFDADARKAAKHEGTIVGGMRSGGDSSKNDLVPTPFIDSDLPVNYFPTPTENTAPDTDMDPDHLGLKKWDEARLRAEADPMVAPAKYIEAAFTLGVVEAAYLDVPGALAAAGVRIDEPISVADSAKGSDFIDSLVRGTAIGPSRSYLGPTKASLCEPGDEVRYTEEALGWIEGRVEDLKRGISRPVVAGISRKIEKDRDYKVILGKARLFYVVDAEEICAGRAIFYRYLEARKAIGQALGFAIGLLPAQYDEIHKISLAYAKRLSSDVTAQDVSQECWIAVAVFAYMLGCGLLGNRDGENIVHPVLPPVDELGVAQFTYLMRCPQVTYKLFSALMEFGAGNPSGGLLTWDINVLANKLTYYWVYCRGNPSPASALSFLENVWFMGGGDDSLLFLRGEAVEKYGPGWESLMNNVGFLVTDPNDKLSPPQMRDMPDGVGSSDEVFLGREWVSKEGGFVGALEMQRIIKILQYCKRGELYTSFPGTILDAYQELKLRGRSDYDWLMSKVPRELAVSWEELNALPRTALLLRLVKALKRMPTPRAEALRTMEQKIADAKRVSAVFQRLRPGIVESELYSRRGEALAAHGPGYVGNLKGALQERCVAHHVSLPMYYTVSSGAPHNPLWISRVTVFGTEFEAHGPTKRDAEHRAAAEALRSVEASNQLVAQGPGEDIAEATQMAANQTPCMPADDPEDEPRLYEDFGQQTDAAAEIMKKSIIIASTTWADASVGSLWQEDGPSFFFDNNFEATKALSNHCYLRGTMVVCARVSSTAYDQGSGVLWCTPLTGPGPRTSHEAVAHHSAYLNVNAKGCAILKIPFVRDRKAVRIWDYGRTPGWFNWFRAGFYVVTPIGARLGASDPTLVIEAYFEDVELIGTLYNPLVLASQGARETKKLQKETLVTEVVETASGALLEMAKIVVKRGAQMMIGAIAAGMNKPLKNPDVMMMKGEPWGGLHYLNGAVPGVNLGDGETAGRMAPPGAFGFADQHLFEVYGRRMGLLGAMYWSTSATTGSGLTTMGDANIWTIPCHPFVKARQLSVVTNVGTWTMYQNPPCSYIGTLMKLWRGTVVITLRAVKTSFHSGTLMVAFCPGDDPTSLVDSQNNYNRLQNFIKCRWDVDKNPEMRIRVPFNSPDAMLQRTRFIGVSESYVDGASSNGWLSLFVETPLRAASEIVQNSIFIEAYMHVEDSSWADPTCVLTGIWRGADYTPPGAKGKSPMSDEAEMQTERKLGRDRIEAHGAGPSDIGSLRAEPTYKGLQAVDAIEWTVPYGGRAWNTEAVRAACGSIFTSFLELGKRPTYPLSYAAGGTSYLYRPDMDNALHFLLASFGWCSGDLQTTFVFVSEGSGQSRRVLFSRVSIDATTGLLAEAAQPFAPIVMSHLAEQHVYHQRLQQSGPRICYALGNALYFQNNTWSVGLKAVLIESTAVQGFGASDYFADNFDLGWQIAPPLARITDIPSSFEQYERQSALNPEY